MDRTYFPMNLPFKMFRYNFLMVSCFRSTTYQIHVGILERNKYQSKIISVPAANMFSLSSFMCIMKMKYKCVFENETILCVLWRGYISSRQEQNVYLGFVLDSGWVGSALKSTFINLGCFLDTLMGPPFYWQEGKSTVLDTPLLPNFGQNIQ